MLKWKLRIKQLDITDCGAACLASVGTYFGYEIPITRIRQYAGTDRKGTNLFGLSEAARKMKMVTSAIRLEKNFLHEVQFPAIAHMLLQGSLYHFVVIYKVSKRKVLIMDPAQGSFISRDRKEFEKEWTGVLLLLAPGEDFEKLREKIPVRIRLFRLISGYWKVFLQALAGAVVYSVLGIAVSLYVEKLVDSIIPSGNINLLKLASLTFIIILVSRTLIGYLKSLIVIKTGQKIDATLVLGYYRHLIRLPQGFFTSMRTGEIVSRVNDAVKVRSFVNNTLLELIVNFLIVAVTLVMMVSYSFKTAAAVFIAIPVYYLFYILFNHLNKKQIRKSMEEAAELESQLVESVKLQGTIKRFGLEEESIEKIDRGFVGLLRTGFKINRNYVMAGNFSELTSGIVLSIVFFTGTMQIFQQSMTAGELLSFYSLYNYLSGPLTSILLSNKSLQDASIAADRLFQIIDLEQETEPEKSINITELKDLSIKINKLGFRYQGQGSILNNISLEFRPGTINAIVGESGSGKSTILSLIEKIELPSEGIISIGDIDYRYISRKELGRIISSVPQETALFKGSLLSNIAPGSEQPDVIKVIEILKELGLADFTDKISNGLGGLIQEDGNGISGGERQRIAIARALYRNPEVLLLDEASSALDFNSENLLIKILKKMREDGKIIVMAAHRLSMARICDQIVVLRNGIIEAKGSHELLIKECSFYKSLQEKQLMQMNSLSFADDVVQHSA